MYNKNNNCYPQSAGFGLGMDRLTWLSLKTIRFFLR
jgi:aspartyl/asparaginyl-tRNA synthetase